MEENKKVLEVVNRISNKKAVIKNETIPVMEEVLTVDGLPFRKYDLIGFVCSLIDRNKLNEAEEILQMTENIYVNKHGSETFERICDAVHDLITYKEIRKDELYYQNIFKAHCKDILGTEYELYDMKNLKPKRPDAWVKYNNIIIPVEMKKGNFGKSALKQLQNYMKLYNCDHGIAIGLKSSIEFPSNIRFVDISEVKQYDD